MLVWSFAFGIMAQAKSPPVDGQFGLTDRLLRAGYRPCAGADDRISRADSDFLVAQIQEFEPKFDQPRGVAEATVELYERLNHKPPGLALSAVFLLAQLVIILLGAVGASALGPKIFSHSESESEYSRLVWVSADGTRIATASSDNTARVWDAANGEELAVLEWDGAALVSVVFSPDGTRIATASSDNTARVWDAATGAELTVLERHGDRVLDVAFSPDGTRIATTSYYEARVWDASTGEQLAELEGHGDGVLGVTFSPDGTRIATVSFDETARVWDAATGEQLAELKGHGDFNRSDVAFSPDGTRVTVVNSRFAVRTYTADGRLVSKIRLRRSRGWWLDGLTRLTWTG
jgi:WD40 repeat protein